MRFWDPMMSAVETRRFSCGGASFSFQVWKAPAAEASAADLAPDEGCAIAAACRESAVPLILLHGFAQSSASWNATASELAATGRPVYALDLVGHGGSERPANPRAYALDAQGEALLAFARLIADVEGVRPAVLGYSMGGRVTLAALHSDPRAFSAVILEAAGFGPATQAEREAVAKRDAACATRLRADGLEAFMDFWEQLPLFASQRDLPPDVRERLRAGRMANDAEALARTFEQAGQHVMPSRAETLETLAVLRAGALKDSFHDFGVEEFRHRAIDAFKALRTLGHFNIGQPFRTVDLHEFAVFINLFTGQRRTARYA